MGTQVGRHEEEGPARISSSQEIEAPVCNPVGRMIFFLVHPGTGQVAVAVDSGVGDICADSQVLLEPVEVIVCDKLGFPVGDACVSRAVKVSVVQFHVVKAEIIAEWVDVHLSDALCVVSRPGKLFRHGVVIVPRNVVLVPDPAVMALLPAGMERCAGSDTAGACAVSGIKDNPAGGKGVQIRCFDVRMSGVTEAVPAELVCHDEYDIGLFWSVHVFCSFV